MTAPIANRVPSTRTHHGDPFIDHYEWLREKESPEVIAYLEAENTYTEKRTADLQPLREKIFEEIKARTKETDLSVPVRRGQWWYYARTVQGQEYALHCRVAVSDARVSTTQDWTPPEIDAENPLDAEQVLLDGNEEARGHKFFALGAFSVSPDGGTLAFSVDTAGDERFTLRFKDLANGQMLPDEITNTSYGATWSAAGTHVFYQTIDDSWRPDKVWRHRLGTSPDGDALVFEETDDRYWVGLGITRSRKYLQIASGSKITSEIKLLDANDPEGEFSTVLPRREGVEYSVEHAVVGGQDRLLILHNENARNFALVETSVDSPSEQRILIEHSDQVRLEDVDAFDGYLVLSYRKEALNRLAIIDLAEGYGEPREIEFAEPLFSSELDSNPEWSVPQVRLGYTSFLTPSTVYDYVLATGELLLRKRQEVQGGYNPDDYVQQRDWAVADDGTKVPLSLIKRKDSVGEAPLLLYGYGSYELSIDPGFSISRLSLLDRGMTFAIAHVRGGGELGRGWYDDGKQLAKRNTFTDFVACARHLIDTGQTSAGRMVAEGGSAGGLLVGAVANLAPELFAGILAVVPFVDPLTSILDPSLPLTVIEWDEWGDPLHEQKVYEYMKSYSPYENIEAKDYPAILAITSLNDTRVLYVEPAKWVAQLRRTKTGDAPLLLKTEMVAGHGGVSGRYEKWEQVAFEYAWVLETAGAVG